MTSNVWNVFAKRKSTDSPSRSTFYNVDAEQLDPVTHARERLSSTSTRLSSNTARSSSTFYTCAFIDQTLSIGSGGSGDVGVCGNQEILSSSGECGSESGSSEKDGCLIVSIINNDSSETDLKEFKDSLERNSNPSDSEMNFPVLLLNDLKKKCLSKQKIPVVTEGNKNIVTKSPQTTNKLKPKTKPKPPVKSHKVHLFNTTNKMNNTNIVNLKQNCLDPSETGLVNEMMSSTKSECSEDVIEAVKNDCVDDIAGSIKSEWFDDVEKQILQIISSVKNESCADIPAPVGEPLLPAGIDPHDTQGSVGCKESGCSGVSEEVQTSVNSTDPTDAMTTMFRPPLRHVVPNSQPKVVQTATSFEKNDKLLHNVPLHCRQGGHRSSFTTEDVDIFHTKKADLSPLPRPTPDVKAKPSVLRRLEDTDIGRHVGIQSVCSKLRRSSSVGEFKIPDIELKPKPATIEKPRVLPPKPPVKTPVHSKELCLNSKPVLSPKPTKRLEDKLNSPICSPKGGSPNPTIAAKPMFIYDAIKAEKTLAINNNNLNFGTCKLTSSCSDMEKLVKTSFMNNSKDVPDRPLGKQESIETEDHEDLESWSSEDPSDTSDLEAAETVTEESDEPAVEKNPLHKAKRIAEELLETEKMYVGRLHLIDQIFCMEIILKNREENFLPADIIPQMFSNVKSIYQFHNDFLLPQLQSCMSNWESDGPCVGKAFKKFAPFLKLYTDYVLNYYTANNLINMWMAKSAKFMAIIEEIHKRPECGHLTLQHHLLEPIQRVPRYQLLLSDYCKHLPKDLEDLTFAQEALELVAKAAQHTNEEMRKIEKFRKLLDATEMLVGIDKDFVTPTRELIKDGKITKVSARDGSLLDRYLFLFNDTLLVCKSLPLKIGFGQEYQIKAKLDIRGMRVLEGNNEESSSTFHIRSKQKSIEFQASSSEAKDEWQKALWGVIKEFMKKGQMDKEILVSNFQEEELGKRAPVWVKDQETSMCMLCSMAFSMIRRRHHCRACGKVVCKLCSSQKVKLVYDDNRENRVCDECYRSLEKRTSTKVPIRHKGVLNVDASDNSAYLSGHLNVSMDRKTWNKRWFVLHVENVLYTYKARKDVTATNSLPLPGYEVSYLGKDEDVQGRENVFKVSRKNLKAVYFFQADDNALMKKWFEALSLAVTADLPPVRHQGNAKHSIMPPSPPTLAPSLSVTIQEMMTEEDENVFPDATT